MGYNASTDQFPMLWASPAGAVTVLLRRRVTVDIGIDRSIRVCLPGIMAVGF